MEPMKPMAPMRPMEPMTSMTPMTPMTAWWPADLGSPSSTGSRNGLHYAFFPDKRRLAIQRDGKTTVYDSADHSIGGVSQQQGGSQHVAFTSQHGTVDLDSLNQV